MLESAAPCWQQIVWALQDSLPSSEKVTRCTLTRWTRVGRDATGVQFTVRLLLCKGVAVHVRGL